MKPEPEKADPASLAVGGFYERTARMRDAYFPPDMMGFGDKSDGPVTDLADPEASSGIVGHSAAGVILDQCWCLPGSLAEHLARFLDNATLIIANPVFDAGYLTAFLNKYGQAGTWHYRVRDIGSLAYGYLHGHPAGEILPIDASTDDYARALGVDVSQYERHTALGDVRLTATMLDVIEGVGQ